MKKICMIILAVLLFTSCGTGDQVYLVQMTSAAEDNFFNGILIADENALLEHTKYDKPFEEKIQIGTQSLMVQKTEMYVYHDGNRANVFQSLDGTVTYTIHDAKNKIWINSNELVTLQPFPQETLSEQSLVLHVTDYAQNLFPDFAFEEAVYSCVTAVYVCRENASWREDRDEFVAPDSISEGEEISSYTISFAICTEFCATEDRIEISCDQSGNIESVYHCNSGCDWGAVSIDQEKLSKSILQYLQKNLKSVYELTGYTIEKQTLISDDEGIRLAVVAEVMLDVNGDEYPLLCSLSVSIG